MTAPNEKARRKLVKLCGRLESSHDGEVLAAAGQLKRFLHEHKLSWEDVIGLGVTEPGPILPSRHGDLRRVQRALKDTLFLTPSERQRLSALAYALLNSTPLSHEDERFLADIYVRTGV